MSHGRGTARHYIKLLYHDLPRLWHSHRALWALCGGLRSGGSVRSPRRNPRMSKIMTWEDLDLEAIATRLEAIGRPSQVGWRK